MLLSSVELSGKKVEKFEKSFKIGETVLKSWKKLNNEKS